MYFLHSYSTRTTLFAALTAAFFASFSQADAGVTFTREYRLKHVDAPLAIKAINFAIPNISKKRIMGGDGKKLVVTEIGASQDEIAALLPVIDQPSKETDPLRIQMELSIRISNHLNREQKYLQTARAAPAAGAAAPVRGDSGAAQTYETRRTTQPYKSVYSDEDDKLRTGPRVIKDDPVLPAVSSLMLKGIFFDKTNHRMALLAYESNSFTARDGDLYFFNRTKMKGYTSQVLKDRVVITGPDRIPREVKFKTSI